MLQFVQRHLCINIKMALSLTGDEFELIRDAFLILDEDGDKLKDADGNQVINYGLKTKYKNQFNAQAAGLLAKTDWYVIKAADVGSYSVPSNIATYRAAVRTKVNAMETSIDGCSDVATLITLLTYTTDSEGVTSRPLGEFPDEVV